MANGSFDVVVIGGGAAGIAAGRRLHDAGVSCLIVEARERLGGRAFTERLPDGTTIDLGCGWLHSADRNPWRAIAESQGRTIDRTPPPWYRPSIDANFPRAEQSEFRNALTAFHERMGSLPEGAPDVPASSLLEPGSRWNGLLGAVTTYLSGTEPPAMSARDFANYDDSGINWRVVEDYGTTIVAHASGVPARLGCRVARIDWSGRRLRIETTSGTIEAGAAIVTLPSNLIARGAIQFIPALNEKTDLASGFPLGLDDKLFLSLAGAEEFDNDTRLFGKTDRTATGAYHLRPFGRPQIEAYFGGSLARELEAGSDDAFFEFARAELTGVLGAGFSKRIAPLRIHRWGSDPFATGAYSSALPGMSGNRARLAQPVDDRIFFAGEACSPSDYSTAHGAYLTGIAAAERIIAANTRGQ